MKKLLCVMLALCMTFCLFACGKAPQEQAATQSEAQTSPEQNTKDSLSLLYCYGDSFNPYLSKTVSNRQIGLLLFDSLVKIDNNFNAVYLLAESVQITDKVCTVTLRDANFSDGSAVTADDVIYSYNLAKESTQYAHNFYEVVSLVAVDSKTVSFELTQYDPYFANLLTFPILKSGTSGITDTDGKEIPPIGCGRYVLSSDATKLDQNQNYFGKLGVIKTIDLINSPDSASTSHYVEVGATDIYYNEDGNIVRMSGKKAEVNMNRLIYIGINNFYGDLASKEMRYAISSAIDREAVCRTAYFNKAASATGYFNPDFAPTIAVQTIQNIPDSKITVENLSKIGYNNMNPDGFYENSEGKHPTFTLIVNSENDSRVTAAKLISEQCKNAGIQIDVIECTYEEYLRCLTEGDFHLYIGEVQILDNMDFSGLVTSNGSAAYGLAQKVEEETDETDKDAVSPENPQEETETEIPKTVCETTLDAYHAGDCGVADVAATLLTEMPQIPICYLNGILFYSSDIQNGVEASAGDIYFNIENYEF